MRVDPSALQASALLCGSSAVNLSSFAPAVEAFLGNGGLAVALDALFSDSAVMQARLRPSTPDERGKELFLLAFQPANQAELLADKCFLDVPQSSHMVTHSWSHHLQSLVMALDSNETSLSGLVQALLSDPAMKQALGPLSDLLGPSTSGLGSPTRGGGPGSGSGGSGGSPAGSGGSHASGWGCGMTGGLDGLLGGLMGSGASGGASGSGASSPGSGVGQAASGAGLGGLLGGLWAAQAAHQQAAVAAKPPVGPAWKASWAAFWAAVPAVAAAALATNQPGAMTGPPA
jgi:hypothetical protein